MPRKPKPKPPADQTPLDRVQPTIHYGSPAPPHVSQYLGDTPEVQSSTEAEDSAITQSATTILQNAEALHTAHAQTKEQQGTQSHTQPQQAQGDTSTAVLAVPESSAPYARGPAENRMAAKWRWARENRLAEIEAWMDQKRSELRDTGMARHRANDMAWEAAIATFPAPGQESRPPPADAESPPETSKPVPGLYLVPSAWPQLPDNASLQAELGWVQSQRLSIVEERGNSVVVHLDRASTPAPSKAALGWLETSIRSYAKYIDIVSRTLAGQQDEQDATRRERLRIDEIRALLDEMHRDAE